jgi:hypothetical protein
VHQVEIDELLILVVDAVMIIASFPSVGALL